MSIQLIAEELAFWYARHQEVERKAVEERGVYVSLSNDATARIAALERVLGYYEPATTKEAQFIAKLLADRSIGTDDRLIGNLARSLQVHLEKCATPDERAADETSLCEKLLEDLTVAWGDASAVDGEIAARKQANASLSAQEARTSARIEAIEDALAATRPQSLRDAAIAGQLLDHELQHHLDEPRGCLVQMISKSLSEFIAAAADTSGDLLPAAYRTRAHSALSVEVNLEGSIGRPH